MPARFPAHLEGQILAGTWTEQRRAHFREFETESGRPIRSKMPGTPETDFQGEVFLDNGEVGDLQTFYAVDCSEGVTNFFMEHPTTGGLEVFRWAAPPSIQHFSADLYRASLALVKE